MKVLFNFLIDSFSLSVGLRMVGGRNIGCRVGKFVKVLSKLCDVLRSLVANNLFRHSKLFPHVVVKVLGHLWCSNGVSCWDENNHLENQSTTTNIALNPSDSGKPVMRSDET